MFIIAIELLLIFGGCNGYVSEERILFDFESDSELERLHWRCHTLFSLSNEHVTHGRSSLRMELYPSDYPGLSLVQKVNDWSSYKTMCFDIFNPEGKEIQVSVRIDDRKDYPEYEDRYSKSLILRPGVNRISISMNTFITAGTQRKLNLRKIYRFFIFMEHLQRKVVLYVDYVRIVR